MKPVSDSTRVRCDVDCNSYHMESSSTKARQNLLGAPQFAFRKTTHPALTCITFPLTLPTAFTRYTRNSRSLFLCITLT
jgi:hypothetical protein